MPAKEIVVDSIPYSYRKKILGEGSSGICYLTEDKRVFKNFKVKIDYYDILKQIANNYQTSHLVLPDTFVFLGDKNEENFVGYLRDYVGGDSLETLSRTTELRKFILALMKAEKEIIQNSLNGLVYLDMNANNVFYTKNEEIKVIDQDLYDISFAYDFKSRAYDNLRDLASTIISKFYGTSDTGNRSIDEFIMICGGSMYDFMRPSELLIKTQEELEKLHGKEIVTYGDFKRSLKRIKEK